MPITRTRAESERPLQHPVSHGMGRREPSDTDGTMVRFCARWLEPSSQTPGWTPRRLGHTWVWSCPDCSRTWNRSGSGSAAACSERWLLVDARGGCRVGDWLEVEDLAGEILVRIGAAQEAPHAPSGDALDGAAEVVLACVLEEQSRLAQALMLTHLGHAALGRGKARLETAEDD